MDTIIVVTYACELTRSQCVQRTSSSTRVGVITFDKRRHCWSLRWSELGSVSSLVARGQHCSAGWATRKALACTHFLRLCRVWFGDAQLCSFKFAFRTDTNSTRNIARFLRCLALSWNTTMLHSRLRHLLSRPRYTVCFGSHRLHAVDRGGLLLQNDLCVCLSVCLCARHSRNLCKNG